MKKSLLLSALFICCIALLQGCASVQSCQGKANCEPTWKDWETWKNNPPELCTRTEKTSQEDWDLRVRIS